MKKNDPKNSIEGQLGSRFSQVRGKRLLEEKGPRGPTHPATVLDLKPGLWTAHQPLLAPIAGQASFPLPVLGDLFSTSHQIPSLLIHYP